MTQVQRSSKRLPLLAVKIGLFLMVACLSACKEPLELHTRLSESDANEVIAALVENSLYAKKQVSKEGISVLIEESDIAKAVEVLRSRGLPRMNRASMGDVFQKEGIISSPLEERARYIYALSQELEYTFSQIQGVIVARVHVVLPEKVAPGEPIQPSSAAVFIKHQEALDPDVVLPKIRRMVASSIPGLADTHSDNIAVVFMPSTLSSIRPLKSELMIDMEQQMGIDLSPMSNANTSMDNNHYYRNIIIALVIFLLLALLTLGRHSIKAYFNRKTATYTKKYEHEGN